MLTFVKVSVMKVRTSRGLHIYEDMMVTNRLA